MTNANTALVRRFYDEFGNGRDASVLAELVSPDYVSHDPQNPPIDLPTAGPDRARVRFGFYQEQVDGFWDVQEILPVGDDRVVVRWIGRGTHKVELMGQAPTGAPLTVEAITIYRIAGGKIAEEWTVYDALGLAQQAGAVPAPAGV